MVGEFVRNRIPEKLEAASRRLYQVGRDSTIARLSADGARLIAVSHFADMLEPMWRRLVGWVHSDGVFVIWKESGFGRSMLQHHLMRFSHRHLQRMLEGSIRRRASFLACPAGHEPSGHQSAEDEEQQHIGQKLVRSRRRL